MSDPHAGHNHAHAPAASPFSEAELHSLHAADIGAARAVVMLMVGIFVIGIVLYTIVAITVAS